MLPNGYIVYPDNDYALERCKVLCRLGLADALEQEVVRCVNHRDWDYDTLSTEEKRCSSWIFVSSFEEGSAVCEECGRKINRKEKKNKYKAWEVSLNLDKISKYIVERLKPEVDHIEEREYSWEILLNRRHSFLVLIGYMPIQFNQDYLFGNVGNTIGLAISDYEYNQFIQSFPLQPAITLQNLIQDPKSVIRLINASSTEQPRKLEVDSCKDLLLSFASSFNSSGSDFENLCLELERNIRDNKQGMEQILNQLKLKQAISYRVLHLGGSGMPDLLRIPLFPYFRDYFTHSGVIESKQYLQSKLRPTHLGQAIRHARHYGQKRILIYALTEDVAPSVWSDVLSVREADGGFLNIVMDTTFIAYLIVAFDLVETMLT